MIFVLKNFSYEGNKILLYKFGGTYRLSCYFYDTKNWVGSKGAKEYIFKTFDEAVIKANSLIMYLGDWDLDISSLLPFNSQTKNDVCLECGEIHGQESYPFEGVYTGLKNK